MYRTAGKSVIFHFITFILLGVRWNTRDLEKCCKYSPDWIALWM